MKPSIVRKVNRSKGWIEADNRRDAALERIAVALEALGLVEQEKASLRDLARQTAEAAYHAARMDEDAAALRRSLAKKAWSDATRERDDAPTTTRGEQSAETNESEV